MVKADFEIALQLATQFDFLFEKGTYDEKRLLCETVFKRLDVQDGKIAKVELNPPFGIIATKGNGSESVLCGEPNTTIAKSGVETFFELAIAPAPSSHGGRAYEQR